MLIKPSEFALVVVELAHLAGIPKALSFPGSTLAPMTTMAAKHRLEAVIDQALQEGH